MYHRYLIKVLVVFLATIAFRIASPELCNAQKNRPNFLFIVTDDQGPWTLSTQNYPNTYTPRIDRLAEE
ncbi:MAG: hypothetical protein KGY70_16345, partial [Bacteroidales bacterium]|nr:hypothetical protein [Bacteroidales bacterium]